MSTTMKISCAILTLFYGFLGLYCFDFQIGNHRGRQASLERFDNTCGDRNVPIIYKYTGMKNEGSKLLMNSTITVKQNITAMDISMIVRIERCKIKENLDTCEHFHDHNINNFCATIESESALWKPLFSVYDPIFECPFKKGIYRAVNSTLDLAAFLLFSMDNWYWRVKVELHDKDTDKMLMCLKAEAHISMKE